MGLGPRGSDTSLGMSWTCESLFICDHEIKRVDLYKLEFAWICLDGYGHAYNF